MLRWACLLFGLNLESSKALVRLLEPYSIKALLRVNQGSIKGELRLKASSDALRF